MRHYLVTVKIKVYPLFCATTFWTAENSAVEVSRSSKVIDRKSDVKRSKVHAKIIPSQRRGWLARFRADYLCISGSSSPRDSPPVRKKLNFLEMLLIKFISWSNRFTSAVIPPTCTDMGQSANCFIAPIKEAGMIWAKGLERVEET
jgi:hypothetical protein